MGRSSGVISAAVARVATAVVGGDCSAHDCPTELLSCAALAWSGRLRLQLDLLLYLLLGGSSLRSGLYRSRLGLRARGVVLGEERQVDEGALMHQAGPSDLCAAESHIHAQARRRIERDGGGQRL